MGCGEESGGRFGGFRNLVCLVFAAAVCLRFAGAEWAGASLGKRVLVAVYLFLGCLVLGLISAALRVILPLIGSAYDRPTIPESIVPGLKDGLVGGAILLFLAGILLVKDFLTPLLDFAKLLISKIPL
jgi:hypothetical protein